MLYPTPSVGERGIMASMSGAKSEETGLASGISNTSYQVGSAIGLTVIVAVASSFLTNPEDIEAITSSIRNAFSAGFVVSIAAIIVAARFIKSK